MVTILAFVVLGSTAWALSRNSVGSKQLKPNAVKESDIAKGLTPNLLDRLLGAIR